MAEVSALAGGRERPAEGWAHAASRAFAHPALAVLVLSLLFGTALIALTQPLRGPDEAAHFLRAYGIAGGQILPVHADERGRRGIHLPRDFHRDFLFYESRYGKERKAFGDHAQLEEYADRHVGEEHGTREGSVFVRLEGSEGYSPIPYFPHVIAAVVARGLGLRFVTTLYLMRASGLVALSCVIAYAIFLLPALGWPFFAISMLPSALYGRAMVSADGVTFAFALVLLCLCVRSALRNTPARVGAEAVWLALCALCKPPNVALALLPFMQRPARGRPLQWPALALVVILALVPALGWFWLSSGDAGAWRLVELTGRPAEQFSLAWKLRFMLENLWHFPAALIGTFDNPVELWRQLIGVLGLFDAPLRTSAYFAITLLLVSACVAKLDGEPQARRRVALVTALAALGYALAVFAIMYLIWTPADANQIWGVQGRYFVPALPLVATCAACLLPRSASEKLAAAAALSAAAISGLASIDAILRADWGFG